MITINTNLMSINARRQLDKSTKELTNSFRKLSSGLRINSAKDDAAGLSIATRMGSQIRGLNQASKNANDGISLVQVAEGSLEETTNALQRIRDLAVQSNNGTYTTSDRISMQDEVSQLLAEITRISSSSTFNTMPLLDGTFQGKTFQIGDRGGQTISVSISGAAASTLGVSGLTISTTTGASAALTSIDTALDSVSSMRAKLGASQNRFESIISNLANVVENMEAAKSRILDADIAKESANMTKQQILSQAGITMLTHANMNSSLALELLK